MKIAETFAPAGIQFDQGEEYGVAIIASIIVGMLYFFSVALYSKNQYFYPL